MFFTSCPNSAIRVVNSEFFMTFIKLLQTGKKQSLALHSGPMFRLTNERWTESLALHPPFFGESCFPGLSGLGDRSPSPVIEELILDPALALCSLTSHVTSLSLPDQ